MAKRRKTQPPHMLLWSRPEQSRFVDAVESLVAIVHTLQDDVAVLRTQIDRLEKLGPKPKKSAAQKVEDAEAAAARTPLAAQ